MEGEQPFQGEEKGIGPCPFHFRRVSQKWAYVLDSLFYIKGR